MCQVCTLCSALAAADLRKVHRPPPPPLRWQRYSWSGRLASFDAVAAAAAAAVGVNQWI